MRPQLQMEEAYGWWTGGVEMSRRKGRTDVEWETPFPDWTWDHVVIEVLMDIRAELQRIRILTECHNVQAGFFAMQSLDKHMKKRFPIKKPSKGPKSSRERLEKL